MLARTAAAVGAGVLLYVSFPPRPFWWLALPALAVLGVLVHGRRAKAAFGYGFLFGMGFLLPLLTWIGALVGPVPWVALVVLEETLREDAAETIAVIREEGVDLKLISGDARATVTAVAYAVGVPQDAGVIEGSELPDDPEGLAEAAQRNTIFCRIAPEQKRALVEALRASGRYTAMIGDGVNDVPALKQARLAVAMGSGAQVTKGIADVVLLTYMYRRSQKNRRRYQFSRAYAYSPFAG